MTTDHDDVAPSVAVRELTGRERWLSLFWDFGIVEPSPSQHAEFDDTLPAEDQPPYAEKPDGAAAACWDAAG